MISNDLVDAFDEACEAGVVIEDSDSRYRFNHALVRASRCWPSFRRCGGYRAASASSSSTLKDQPGADDELLSELSVPLLRDSRGRATQPKQWSYCRRTARPGDGAAPPTKARPTSTTRRLHALEEIDDDLPDHDEQVAVTARRALLRHCWPRVMSLRRRARCRNCRRRRAVPSVSRRGRRASTANCRC